LLEKLKKLPLVSKLWEEMTLRHDKLLHLIKIRWKR